MAAIRRSHFLYILKVIAALQLARARNSIWLFIFPLERRNPQQYFSKARESLGPCVLVFLVYIRD